MSHRLPASLALLLVLLAVIVVSAAPHSSEAGNPPPPSRTPYEILGVRPSATAADILAAYERLTKNTPITTLLAFVRGRSYDASIKSAFDLLINPDSRLLYDYVHGHIGVVRYLLGVTLEDVITCITAWLSLLFFALVGLFLALCCAKCVYGAIYWVCGTIYWLLEAVWTHRAWLRACVVMWSGPLLMCLAQCYAPPLSSSVEVAVIRGVSPLPPMHPLMQDTQGNSSSFEVASCAEWARIYPAELASDAEDSRRLSVVLCSDADLYGDTWDARSFGRWLVNALMILAMRWAGALSHISFAVWLYHRTAKLDWRFLASALGIHMIFFGILAGVISSKSFFDIPFSCFRVLMSYWSVVVEVPGLFYQFVARTVGSALWCPAPGRHPTLDWTALGTTTNEWMCPFGPDDYNRFHLDWPRTVWNKFPFLGRRVA